MMFEFIQEIFSTVNLPATILLLLVVVYWIFVIVGAIGIDAFDFDLSSGGDVGGGLDVDGDVGDVGGEHGPLAAALHFFHLGDVPVTFFGSVFAVLFWFTTIIGNHYINTNWSVIVGLYLLVPCLLASLLVTKLVLWPTVPLFKKLNQSDPASKPLIGQRARVTTSELTDKFGQVQIDHDGPPIVLNARCLGAKLGRGDIVELVSYEADSNTYLVRLPK